MAKAKPIRSKDGKHLAGSIGAGKTEVPKPQKKSKTTVSKAIVKKRASRKITPYYERFNDFPGNVVSITRELINSRPSKMEQAAREDAFQKWIQLVSEEIVINAPEVKWSDDTALTEKYGCYDWPTNVIWLDYSHPSIITLMHEYRHALQRDDSYNKGQIKMRDIEEDARAWSQSLYYKTDPKIFLKLLSEGRVAHSI